ncbi:sporulation peptidase YabG [Carboxydothermus pertinax]|uniref:Peptidase n=1 Tax=Carboxydothermus pertinax TaxID=870242 RepID=A0A1L8CTB6_9THEO|nr:sporulation peptidase YabG [Carboxydothermus pertinax]GAV22147.1 peptidase [Carboxydothermus pertinax]
MISVGDIVARKSYGMDIYFRVVEVNKKNNVEIAHLKGIDVRLCADAPLTDLVKINTADYQRYLSRIMDKVREKKDYIRKERNLRYYMRGDQGEQYFKRPGTVLHLDGDPNYLEMCLHTYQELNIPSYGYVVPEKDQPERVEELYYKHLPDIVVLTGHDALLKNKSNLKDLNSYRNSRYFVEAVRILRQKIDRDKDNLVIFAGACQSYFEALLEAGANFASAPERVLIHAYDPVFVAEKIAYSSIYDPLTVREVVINTITGSKGIGGVDTRGKLRLGFPMV